MRSWRSSMLRGPCLSIPLTSAAVAVAVAPAAVKLALASPWTWPATPTSPATPGPPTSRPLTRCSRFSEAAGTRFVAKINASGTALVYSTYLGGGSVDPDVGNGIAVDAAGNAYVTGSTSSADFPTVNAFQAVLGGNLDAFVAKLIPSHIVDELVTFIPIESTFNSSPNTAACPTGFIGEFNFSARLTDKESSPSISKLVANVTTLTNGNLLRNADGEPGGIGNTLTIPRAENFSDGVLSPGEFVDVPFSICLKNQESFNFFVDVHVLE